jgi:hypothetical protein
LDEHLPVTFSLNSNELLPFQFSSSRGRHRQRNYRYRVKMAFPLLKIFSRKRDFQRLHSGEVEQKATKGTKGRLGHRR